MGKKYGNTDPSQYQLRDMQRRITKIEKAFDRLIIRHERFVSKIRAQVPVPAAVAAVSEEE